MAFKRFRATRQRVSRSFSSYRSRRSARRSARRSNPHFSKYKKKSLLTKVLIGGGLIFAFIKWGLPAWKAHQAKAKLTPKK